MDSTEDEFEVEESMLQAQLKPVRTYKRTKANDSGNDFTLPKKTAKQTTIVTSGVSTQNYYAPLTTITTGTTDTPTTSTATTIPTTTTNTTKFNKEPTPPAIVIDRKYTSSRLLVQVKTSLRNEYTATYNAQGLRIQCSKIEDYNTLQNFLNTSKLQYFTYQPTNKNLVKAIIRGLPPNFLEEEILTELQGNQLPAISVRQFKRSQVDPLTEVRTKTPLPVWLVTLTNEAGARERIHQLTGLFNLKIKVEDYEGTPSPVQCYRCQRFGHKAQGCNLQSKCVKCAGDHNTKECTKDPISPATCSNCNGPHPANYRQCPKFVAYSRPFTSPQPSPPTQNNTNFPGLRPTRTNIPNFNRQENSTQRQTANNTLTDFKDILTLFRSFNIKYYLSKIKDIIKEVARQPDVISKGLTLITSFCSLFENGCDN